ncbi:carboxymuconolactone decarboxylase family protein [Methanolobus halotolerans]|uniref:Carboxymuconolactone decarboxylase family protein n=1 Tax=Methanolobus halotolerans TaxID=2052935 RepID=A0A4E0PWI0_9EURY|nr:carboxymuconolactone decarboxylase family protein [Methanolobus halotolerans]TGC08908.1 carboxymuconolactone decarboxylase family protein [Methanolobus halotolerans]
MTDDTQEIQDIKGFQPRSVRYAKQLNEDFAEGLSGLYSAVWADRDNGLSKKNKHLLVFAIACSNLKTESAVKILQRLKKFGATPEEVKDAMMIAAWTGGIQNFTDFTPNILKEMERLGF